MYTKSTWLRWSKMNVGPNAVISLICASLIGLMWYTLIGVLRVERENTVRAAIDKNDNLAIAFEQYVVRTIESADAVIQYLLLEYKRSGEKLDLARFVAEYTIKNKVFTGIVLVDEHGNGLTTATGQGLQRLNVSDREHFTVHFDHDAGNVIVGKPVTGRLTGKAVVPVTRRINKADGTFGGVAMILIEPARFTDFLQDASLRPLDVLTVVGMDGITRARMKGTTTSSGENVSKGRLFVEQARRPVGNYFAPGQLDGIPKFFSYRTVPNFQLMTVVGTAEIDVLADYYQRRRRYFWAAGLTSGVLLGFAIILMLTLASRRRATASVARNQARFLATFNQAAVGISHTHLDGRFLDVNQKLCDILGYSKAELMARSFADITHPDDIAANNEGRKHLLTYSNANESQEMEKRYLRKDGTIVWAMLSISVVRDAAGHPDYFAALVQDISDRKRSQQALAQMAAIVASSSDAIISRSLDGHILSWNKAAERILGWTAQEAIGQPIRIIVPPEQPGQRLAVRAIQGEQIDPVDVRRMRKDGTRFDAQITVSPVRDENGKVTSLSTILRDVTEYKRVQKELKALEREQRELARQAQTESARLVAAQAVAKIGSWETELPSLKVIWSAETYRIFEVDPVHFQPTHLRFLEFIPPEDRIKVDAAFTSTIDQRMPGAIEHQIVMSDGRVKMVEERWHITCDGHGSAIRVIGTCQDITERKQAELALRKFAKQISILYRRLYDAEEKQKREINRELHDRVGANLSALSLDLAIIYSTIPEDVKQLVSSRIEKAQNLVLDTTAQVRDVMSNLRPPSIDEFGLLSALRVYAHTYSDRVGVSVNVEGDEIVPRPPSIVETALFRIAQEALNNVAKHAHAKHVAIMLNEADHRIKLSIIDDGTGFNIDALDPKRVTWGLNTMRERADAIGAALRIESAPGQGTRIIVEVSREVA